MLSLSNYTLTQLEYVVALQKHGHFGKAATACNVTQPTLSMQIQKLEESLGVILFDRSKKPIITTDVGRSIIGQIQTVLLEARKIDVLAERQLNSEPQGDLHLGVIPTVAPYVLPRLFPTLAKRYPKIRLMIKEMQTHRIVEAVENDEIDVGLLATPLNISKMIEFALFYEPFYLLCNSQHEFASKKKIEHSSLNYDDLWLLEEGHCLRHQVLDLCSMKHKKNKENGFQFESGSLETLKKLVASYRGYTLLPALAAEELPPRTKVIEFERPIPAREIGLVYRREHLKNDLIEALGASVIESIPESLRKIRKRDLDVLPI
jgi:LysR family transcriptional regulator, hydrogen peroxide-inducible genes activator